MNMYNLYIYILSYMIKTTPDFVKKFSIPGIPALEVIKKYQVECAPGATRWVISASASANNEEKQWFKRIILQCFQYFVFWKGNYINCIICYRACDLLVSLQLVSCLQFPGFHWLVTWNHSLPWHDWFSIHVFLHENHVSWMVFHVDPRKLQYFCFLPMLKFIWFSIHDLWTVLCQPADAEASKKCFMLMRSRKFHTTQTKTHMSPKKGSFRKQSSLPTTIFSRTCMFSGK